MKYFSWLVCILYIPSLHAVFVGNPLDPTLYHQGIFATCQKAFSMRLGYIQEYIYRGQYSDEFPTIESTNSDNSLCTYGGILTFNFLNRVDVYGMLGNTQLEVDRVIFDKRRVSWAGGAKIMIYKYHHFALGIDIKHFATKSKPSYFLIDGIPANLITDFSLRYEETQGALGVSYAGELLSPYLGLTYLFSRITPLPSSGALDLPNFSLLLDFEIRKALNRKRWGLVIGTSILSQQSVTVNIESRIFDQNSVNITGEIRF